MNPLKFKMAMDYLTRAKKAKPDLPDVFPASQAPIPPVKPEVELKDAINAFIRRERQQKAGGGMLVQPGFGGVRQGYRDDRPKKKNLPKGVVWNKQKDNYRVVATRGGKKIQKQYGKSTWGSYKKALKAATKDAKEFFENTPRKFGEQTQPNLTEEKLKQYIKNFKKENKILPNKTNIRNHFNTSNKVIEDILEKNPKIKIGTYTLTDEVRAAAAQRAKDFATKNKTNFWTKNQPIDVSTGDVYDLDKYLNLPKTTRMKVDKVTLGIYDEIKPKNNKIYKSPFGTELKNRLLTFMYRAAVHAENKNIKNPNYKLIYDNKKLVGVEDVRLNTIYGTSTKNTIERGHTPIAKHPDYGKITEFVTLSKQGMSSSPKVLESYFLKNSKLPSYAEIYNYMYTRPGAKKDLSQNPLHFHHQALVEVEPSKYGQLLLADKNKFIDSQYRKYQNNVISLQEFDKSLKDLNTRFRLPETGKFIGTLARDIGKLPIQVAQAKKDIVSEFKKRALKDSDYGIKLQLAVIGCPNKVFKASGGRVGYQDGTDICSTKGANLINSGMKNASPAQLKNFAAFANRTASLGRGVMKFGVIPEALFVAADSAIRMGMGDNFNEAFLRATDYLRPGDQTKLAEMLEADRFFGPEVAGIIGRSLDYKNKLANVQSLQDQKANLENLSGGGTFDYIGDLSQDVKNIDTRLKQATDDLNKFKMTDSEQIYADRMQEEVDDARTAGSFFTKLKSKFRDIEPDSDIETLGMPEKTQKELNKKVLPALFDSKDYITMSTQDAINLAQAYRAQGDNISAKDILAYRDSLRNASLSELAQQFNPESVYGASGIMGEPINKPVFKKPQNVIGDMEKEIVGQTNVANPFDFDLSMIGSGLRGFAAAGGGIAKQAGVDSGPPPSSGPNSQGLQGLMKRVKRM